jgi:hypothetical protein
MPPSPINEIGKISSLYQTLTLRAAENITAKMRTGKVIALPYRRDAEILSPQFGQLNGFVNGTLRREIPP